VRLGTAAFAIAAALAPLPAAAEADDCAGGWRPAVANARNEPVRFTREGRPALRVVRAVGATDVGAAARLQQAIAAGHVDEVWLHSTGGDAAEALRIGQLLRGSGIATRIPAGAVCAGACAEAFLGGTARFVDEGGRLGFSGVPIAKRRPTAAHTREQAGARWAEQRADYYIRAGVSRGLLRLQLQGTANRVCFLSATGLGRYNVTNALPR
jgi:hypothetical protein